MQDWQSLSEITFGLVLSGKLDTTQFQAVNFFEPYHKGFTAWKESGSTTKVVQIISDSHLNTAMEAAKAVSSVDVEEIDWAERLRYAANAYKLGVETGKLSKKLIKGERIELSEATELGASFKDLANPKNVGLTQSNEIDLDSEEDIIESGYLPIDKHLGGIPASGNILVMGSTGIGKSLWSQIFLGGFLNQYKEKKAAVFSLEMTSAQYLRRGVSLYPQFKEAHSRGQVFVSDRTTTIDTVGFEVAAGGYDIVVVDYIDYLIKGEGSESKYAEVYKAMNDISRDLKIPFVMLLQPNRQVYTQGIPKMWHARYSGMAENVAAQFWALYSPSSDEETNGDFIYVENSKYLICWKSRFGYKSGARIDPDGKDRKGPGAIVLPNVREVWANNTTGEWIKHGDVQHTMTKGKKKRSED
jgi:hypothetical protein